MTLLNASDNIAFSAWLFDRPEHVQSLAREFPPGTVLTCNDCRLYLIGYNEENCLILSKVDPFKDYERALKNKVYISADTVRTAKERNPTWP